MQCYNMKYLSNTEIGPLMPSDQHFSSLALGDLIENLEK